MSLSAKLPRDDNGPHDDGDDIMPVDRQTSFNGKLNRYFHHVMKVDSPRPSASPSMIKKETVKIEWVDDDDDDNDQPIARITRSQSVQKFRPPSPSKRSSSSSSSSPAPTKKRKRRSRTDDPTISLPSLLRDTIPPDLILLLVGVNPGLMTGSTGFAYAHPSNLFWKLLHSSGITTIRHPPSDTYRLPKLYSVGNTNIVERPTRDASMLSKAEMNVGVEILEAKIAANRPEAVCLVGKSIWEAVWRVKHGGRPIRKDEFRYGWQDEGENMGRAVDWNGAPVFVATTTSGLAAGMSPAEKQAVWNELGAWVVRRRQERKDARAAAIEPGILGEPVT